MLRNDERACRRRRKTRRTAGSVPLERLVNSGPSPFVWWARGEITPVAPKCLDRLAVDRQLSLERCLGSDATELVLELTELTETLACGWHFLTGLRLGTLAHQRGGWTEAELRAAMLEAARALDAVN